MPGKFFNTVRKSVDCTALYANEENDAPTKVWPPPIKIPKSIDQDYTLNGTVKVYPWYLYQKYSGGNGTKSNLGAQQKQFESVWTVKHIDEQIDQAKKGTLGGTYGQRYTNTIRAFLQKHQDSIKGKRFFTLGSERPWLEALLLEAGAEHVTTIEYGAIQSEDPRVTAVTPAEIRKMYLKSP